MFIKAIKAIKSIGSEEELLLNTDYIIKIDNINELYATAWVIIFDEMCKYEIPRAELERFLKGE